MRSTRSGENEPLRIGSSRLPEERIFVLGDGEIEDYLPINLEKLLEKADFTKVQHIYRQNFAEYHRFLTENKLNHVLPKPVAAPADKPQSVPNLVQVPHNIHEAVSWFRSEIDFMTGEVEVLRNRAWNLETSLRSLKEAPAAKVAAE